jgi:rare lipoprotein A
LAIVISAAVALTACTGAPSLKTGLKSGTKEYFAESEYGVKASPRVSNMRSRLPRGGGRAMVGKPYKVKGKWYKPKEEPNYSKVGSASWYGDAFHGRLTANGEIYDMTHLTAAHPTMPLPSYARVTNQKNGASVIVRVNDRGPFAHGRIVDLSKRAAEMLDYKHAGVAKVKVEYLGRAPLHGKDDQYLLASYRPGRGGPVRIQDQLPGIDDGQPSGVMIAMNGRTPAGGDSLRRRSLFDALPGGRRNNPIAVAPAPQPVMTASALPERSSRLADIVVAGDPILPDIGPYVPERPIGGLASDAERLALPLMSYADRRVAAAASPFEALGSLDMSADDVIASWKRVNGEPTVQQQYGAAPEGSYLAAGSFTNAEEARTRADLLSSVGEVRIVRDADAWSVVMVAEGPALDALARAAWQSGATDAFVVRSDWLR